MPEIELDPIQAELMEMHQERRAAAMETVKELHAQAQKILEQAEALQHEAAKRETKAMRLVLASHGFDDQEPKRAALEKRDNGMLYLIWGDALEASSGKASQGSSPGADSEQALDGGVGSAADVSE